MRRLANFEEQWDRSPPSGARLHIADVAADLKVSVRDLAFAVGLGVTTTYYLLSLNRWPRRPQRWVLESKFKDALTKKGAAAQDLDCLFYGARTQLRRASSQVESHESAEGEADVLLPKTTLTPKAARHFKLFRNPFDGEVLTDEQFFLSADIEYAKEAIWQCAQTSSFVALCGESGSGKTTILAELEERLASQDRSVIVIRPSVVGMEENDVKGKTLKSADILHAVINRFDPVSPVPQSLQARSASAKRLLMASSDMGNSHLLVVEEAHSMPDATLKHLKRMHELRAGRRPLLGILLLAQPELKRRLSAGLRDGTLREVAQRCEIVQLLPLDDEIKAYLECRARAVGVELARVIDDGGVEQLRQRLTKRIDAKTAISMAYPLAVHNLITRAMNLAADIGSTIVTDEVVRNA
jgi:type II secretory pathway predicted ATPase ExeA